MTDLERRFIKARRDAIAADYQNLNEQQRRGVLATEGPLLLLAGAGSIAANVLRLIDCIDKPQPRRRRMA